MFCAQIRRHRSSLISSGTAAPSKERHRAPAENTQPLRAPSSTADSPASMGVGIHRRIAAGAALHPQVQAHLAPGELIPAGKVQRRTAAVDPIPAAELRIQRVQRMMVEILFLQGRSRQAVDLLKCPVHGLRHLFKVRPGHSSRRFTTRERTESTPLLAILAVEGLRYRPIFVMSASTSSVPLWNALPLWA